MSDRRSTRDGHILNEDGMLACNPRDREAAHRAAMGDIAIGERADVTCQKCLIWIRSGNRKNGAAIGQD